MTGYLTAAEVAECLGTTHGTARNIMGGYDRKIRIKNGHLARAWRRDRVLAVRIDRDLRGVKRRAKSVRQKKHPGPVRFNKSLEFDLDRFGNQIPLKQTFRGRVCRVHGCDVPVPTGKLFCEKHTEVFQAMKKVAAHHAEIYTCHA